MNHDYCSYVVSFSTAAGEVEVSCTSRVGSSDAISQARSISPELSDAEMVGCEVTADGVPYHAPRSDSYPATPSRWSVESDAERLAVQAEALAEMRPYGGYGDDDPSPYSGTYSEC